MNATHVLPTVVSRNGALIPPQAATVSVLGNTLYGAYGVYESIQLWNGCIFHLADHLERLAHSAQVIDLPLAGDLAAHQAWVEALVAAEGVPDATIRLFALGPEQDAPPSTFIWLTPIHRPGPAMYATGVGAVTYRGERALPTAKTLNTLVNTLARRQAAARQEHEGLLVDFDGNVREGATSTFYAVQEGVLCLPPPEDILEGVTLQIVLRLAAQAGLPVVRRKLPLAEGERWSECFLTSTSRHVLPLVRVDGQPVGDGCPGPVTRQLHQDFEAYFQRVTGRRYGGN